MLSPRLIIDMVRTNREKPEAKFYLLYPVLKNIEANWTEIHLRIKFSQLTRDSYFLLSIYCLENENYYQ